MAQFNPNNNPIPPIGTPAWYSFVKQRNDYAKSTGATSTIDPQTGAQYSGYLSDGSPNLIFGIDDPSAESYKYQQDLKARTANMTPQDWENMWGSAPAPEKNPAFSKWPSQPYQGYGTPNKSVDGTLPMQFGTEYYTGNNPGNNQPANPTQTPMTQTPNMDTAKLAQYNQIYQQAMQGNIDPIQMTQGGSGQGLQQFQNSPGYNLSYGPNTLNQFQNSPNYKAIYGNSPITGGLKDFTNSSNYKAIYGNNPLTGTVQDIFNSPNYQLMYGNNRELDPAKRFENDPGNQMALKLALDSVGHNFASKGLANSGAFARGTQEAAYQNYNNWINQQGNLQNAQQGNVNNLLNAYQGNVNNLLGSYQNNQNSLFGNYQNQLSQLANMGAQYTGSNNAMSLGNMLAQLFSSANLGTGQGIANANLGVGNSIAELLANQGVLNANAILNTTAAQGNNIFQGNLAQAQLNAANLASQAGTMSNNASAQGFANNSGGFGGGAVGGAVSRIGTGGFPNTSVQYTGGFF